MRREPVREVLGRASYHGPNEFGLYLITFPEGVEVEFSAIGLELDEPFTGCAFHIRLGGGLMKFILEVARAGDMVIVPAMEGSPLILVSKDQQFQVRLKFSSSFDESLWNRQENWEPYLREDSRAGQLTLNQSVKGTGER